MEDEYQGQGGSYTVQDGKRVLTERTQDHPDGNGPRPAQETIAEPAQTETPTAQSATETAPTPAAAEPQAPAAQPAAELEAPVDPSARQAAIVEASAKLDKSDKTNWTSDGRPNAGALTQLLGWPVSAADRDAAWATVQPNGGS